MGDDEKRERGKRVAALRYACGLTQEQLAERALTLPRTAVVKVESGVNAVTSAARQSALATAFGVSVDVLVEYLDGALEVGDVLSRRGAVSLSVPAALVRTIEEHPTRWRASTLLTAVERVRHLHGAPDRGWPAFLDELERGVPVGSPADVDALVEDIERQAKPKRRR